MSEEKDISQQEKASPKINGHITEKWLVKSSESIASIGITESLMNLVSSNFLCL